MFISAKLLSAQPDGVPVQFRITDHKICLFSDRDGANAVRAAQLSGRIERRRPDRFIPRNSEAHGILHTLVQCRRRTRDGAVLESGDPALQEDILSSQGILSVRHAAASQGIRDQADAPREKPERHPYSTGMNMLAVADEFCIDILPFRGCADHTGLAVMDGRHGVVEVGQMVQISAREGRLHGVLSPP